MQSLKFKQLLLISDSTKSANRFEFHEHLTIITADNNNLGKSTLAKLLFWSIGCDPDFDTNWKSLDCKVILQFSIGDCNYETMRYKDFIWLNENGKIIFYSKITGEFAVKIAEILNFHALLPKRNSSILETPPPAYFFIPFYIDQKRSWTNAWDNFDNLQQYERWKSTIIKYHIGLLPKKHFDLELNKYAKKNSEDLVKDEINKLNTALEIVNDYIPQNTITINKEKLQEITKEIRVDLKMLAEHQEKTIDELTKLEGDKSFYLHQQALSEQIIIELDKDYKYTIENLIENYIECPLCGTTHDNSIINRASILTDKQQAERQLNEINLTLSKIDIQLEKVQLEIDKTRNTINEIHDKYLIKDDEKEICLNDIIENIAGNAIKENVQKSKSDKLLIVDKLKSEIKEIIKEQQEILTKEEKERITEDFNRIFVSYIDLLNAEDINLSNINSPLDFSKIVKEGGAAEGTRGILAYYMSIYSLIEQYGNNVIAPLVIDTPNQQEQSNTNYEKILELITTKISHNSQIFLCALSTEKLDEIKQNAKVIHLNINKLLNENDFDNIKLEFDKYLFDEINKVNSPEEGTITEYEL